MSKGDLLDQIPPEKLAQLVGMLRASFQLDDRELEERVRGAWADGYRSVMGLHDRAQHVLQYGDGA